jgi:DNA recombination protein RmuC
METYIFLVIGLLVGAALGWLIASRRSTGSASGATNLAEDLAATRASLGAERARAERAELLLRQKEEADKASSERENKILLALSPVQTKLAQMETKVSEMDTASRTTLAELMKGLENTLNESHLLRNQTNALAMAMNDNRTRGAWGEMQLKRTVEAAGLQDKVDFYTQDVKSDADGKNIKPDMVVRLPDNKSLPVDAKVPFDAYLEAMSITDLSNPAETRRQQQLLEKHVSDLRGHVKALGNKKYWQGYADSPEFVIAFIPSESLLSGALQQDPSLLEFAFSSKVVLATPNNLFSILKTIALIWQNTVNQAALANVINLGKEIFTRLNVVAGHADKVGKHLDSAIASYNAFVGSLEQNLFTSARRANEIDSAQFGVIEIVEPRMLDNHATPFKKFDVESLAIEPTDGEQPKE